MRLNATVRGSGPALVLLHGFTGSGATWDGMFADEYRTHALDLPGHGRSPVGPRSLWQTADDVLESVGDQTFALLGYSLGARVALHVALRAPDRVRALILEGGNPGLGSESERRRRRDDDEELARLLETEGIAAFVDRWERLPLWASQAQVDPARRQALRTSRLASDAAGLAASLRASGLGTQDDLAPRLREIACPALLMAGSLDVRYAELAAGMAAAMAAANVAIVPGAGHAAHFEEPRAFERTVRAFLAGLA